MAVDYSRSALTAMLLREQNCMGLRVVGGLHEAKFGRDSWSSETRCRLEQELKKLIGIPKAEAVGPRGERIDAVVMTGEASDDSRLREVLRDVLYFDAALGTTRKIGNDQYRDGRRFDPVFAASHELADNNWWNQLEEEGVNI